MDFFRNETDFLQWVKTIFIERHNGARVLARLRNSLPRKVFP